MGKLYMLIYNDRLTLYESDSLRTAAMLDGEPNHVRLDNGLMILPSILVNLSLDQEKKPDEPYVRHWNSNLQQVAVSRQTWLSQLLNAAAPEN